MSRRCAAASPRAIPFIFGFTVYESFESDAVARTGNVPMPEGDERTLGGHAMCVVGYDNPKKLLHRAQLVGRELGKERLRHDAVRVLHQHRSLGGLLDAAR